MFNALQYSSVLPKAEAARLYSFETLVEKTPESSVQITKGWFALYKSAALPITGCYNGDSNFWSQKISTHAAIINSCIEVLP